MMANPSLIPWVPFRPLLTSPDSVPSICVCVNSGAGEDTMDPRQQPNIEEFMRLCHYLFDYANERRGLPDDECEGIVIIVYYGQQHKRTVCPYDDLDDLAASIAFSKLTSSFD